MPHNIDCTHELVERIYETTNHTHPRLIAASYGLLVKVEDLPDSIMAIYTQIGVRSFIVVSESDSDEFQQYATAVALYYHFTDQPRILMREGPSDGDYNAAHFAYALVKRSEGLEGIEKFVLPEEIIRKGKERLM